MTETTTNDSYTQINNHLLEELPRFNFKAIDYKILLVVIRFTLGQDRESHEFGLNFFYYHLNHSNSGIKKSLDKLIKNHVLIVLQKPSIHSPRRLMLNQDTTQWTVERLVHEKKKPYEDRFLYEQ